MEVAGKIVGIGCVFLVLLIAYMSTLEVKVSSPNKFIDQQIIPEVVLYVDSTFKQAGFHLQYEATFRLEKSHSLDNCKIEMLWESVPREVLLDIESINRDNQIKFALDKCIDIEAPANLAQPFSLSAQDIAEDSKILLMFQARYIAASLDQMYFEFTLPRPKFRVKCRQGEGLYIADSDSSSALITEHTAKRSFNFLYRIKYKNDDLRVVIPVMPKRRAYYIATISVHTALSLSLSAILLKPLFNKKL